MDDVPDTRDSLLLRVANPGDQGAWELFARIYRPQQNRQYGLMPENSCVISRLTPTSCHRFRGTGQDQKVVMIPGITKGAPTAGPLRLQKLHRSSPC